MTLRYRALLDLVYAMALRRLLEYARESKDDFEYGPMDLRAMHDQGLIVAGPRLEGVQKAVEEIPGLYLVDG